MAHVRFLEPRNKTRLTIDIARSLRIDQNNSHSLQGYNLVILDDVIGTHTTLDACISVLSSLEPSFVFSLALFKREVENRG
jgi:hypoxanthine phosphoribosyltransferase